MKQIEWKIVLASILSHLQLLQLYLLPNVVVMKEHLAIPSKPKIFEILAPAFYKIKICWLLILIVVFIGYYYSLSFYHFYHFLNYYNYKF